MSTTWERPLVLASSSPRRRELLTAVGIPLEVVPAADDTETPPSGSGEKAVVDLARRKAGTVARRLPGRVVLAADTLVRVDGSLLGKPADPEEARHMLGVLSGRSHEVLTGVVLSKADGWSGERISVTRVRFAALTPGEIDAYVSGPEPYDKAGGYGIQSAGGWFVTGIEGSYSNVMGLPLEAVRELLAEAALPLPSLGPRRSTTGSFDPEAGQPDS